MTSSKLLRAEGKTPSAWRPGTEWLFILTLFFVVGGAPAPHVNEAHYLTKAKHYWNPSFCGNDAFLNSADAHLTFYWTFGWLTRWVSLPAAAWMGRVVSWALLAAAWQKLSRAVVAAPWAAALSAVLWVTLVETADFAGEWMVGGVEAKGFAYALVLLGLAAMCRGRWNATWMWFGAAAAFHVLVGAWAVLAGLCVWVTEPRRGRASLRSFLSGLVIGGLLSLPGLAPALALERGTDSATGTEAARIYVFERLPHHLAPLSLSAGELHKHSWRFGSLSLVFLALWFWSALGAGSEATTTESNKKQEVDPRAALLRIMRFAAFSLAANGIGLTLEASLSSDPLRAARVLRYYWFRQADFAVPLAVAIAGTKLVWTLSRRRSPWGTLAAALPLAGCCWFLFSTAYERVQDPQPPATARLERFADWQDACEWIRDHAPADARFLIPRMGHSFKWYAQRADVANYKDIPQDAAGVVAWRKRCNDVFPTATIDGKWVMLSFPDQLGTKRIRALAAKYGASHVMARRYPPLDLKVVYPDKGRLGESYYTVYETGVPTTAASP